MVLLLLWTVAVLAVTIPAVVAFRRGRVWALGLPWLLPIGMLVWSYVLSTTEDPDECNEACASAWLFVGAVVAAAPAVLGTVIAGVALVMRRRRA